VQRIAKIGSGKILISKHIAVPVPDADLPKRIGSATRGTMQKFNAAELFLITLMFNQLKGKRESVIAQMRQGAERAYGTLLNQMYRHPGDIPSTELPLWILVPDLPVPKHSKQPLRDLRQRWNAPARNGGDATKHPAKRTLGPAR
jgi:hypothetical protein